MLSTSKKWLFLQLACLFSGCITSTFAQRYNYVSYTTREGLPGNLVYDMLQTQEGFIWFGTDNGLSRFDGKNFKNYTVKDGLPDNEVLALYEDKQQRLWINTFSNHFCYYKDGKFFHSGRDSVFSGLKPKSRPFYFYEDTLGGFWIFCERNIYMWKSQGFFHEVNYFPSLTDRIKTVQIHPLIALNPKRMYLAFNDSVFEKDANGKLHFLKEQKVQSTSDFIYQSTSRYGGEKISIGYDILTHTLKDDKMHHLLSTVNGAYELDQPPKKIIDSFLIGIGVTRSILDREGIYWFSTLGDGVYKLVSKYSKVFTLRNGVNSINEVFSIGLWKGRVVTGHGGSRLIVWDEKGSPTELNLNHFLKKVESSIATNRLRVIKKLDESNLILGFDSYLVKWNGRVIEWLPVAAIKNIEFIGKDSLLIASGTGVFQMSHSKFNKPDTIWNSRSTSAIKHDREYYIGTLYGLYNLDKNRNQTFLGKLHPTLQRRISGIKSIGNTVWVATSDSGLVALQNGKVIQTISEIDGLSSNICRVLETDGMHLWVGTNKGLNKVILGDQKPQIRIYNSYNVLPGDAISSILFHENKLYVGTPEGLTVFEENFFKKNLFCNVNIDGARVGNTFFNEGEHPIVTHKNNRIEFLLSGITTQAAGNVNFVVKLEGFDEEWHTENDPSVVYSNLPAGTYVFKARAENIFGGKSALEMMEIEVVTPFWYSYKFWIIFVLSGAILAGILINRNVKRKQKKLEQQMEMERQMASLEQKALQAQMNPHFIFNSLNSIQQYIITNNVKDANKYLSIFGGLIRETMEFSSQATISLEKEINYINKYLQLEQMRFGNRFQYKVDADTIENPNKWQIPGMLIQPFVENAVRHGVRYRDDDKGLVEVIFHKDNGTLNCHICDNGIGRKASGEIKSRQHIEYQSRGMDLTEKRIAMLNKVHGEKVSLLVIDKEQVGNTGTEIIIKIKLNQNDE